MWYWIRIIIQFFWVMMYFGYVVVHCAKFIKLRRAYNERNRFKVVDINSPKFGKPNSLIQEIEGKYRSGKKAFNLVIAFVGLQMLMLIFGGFYDETIEWLKEMVILIW